MSRAVIASYATGIHVLEATEQDKDMPASLQSCAETLACQDDTIVEHNFLL